MTTYPHSLLEVTMKAILKYYIIVYTTTGESIPENRKKYNSIAKKKKKKKKISRGSSYSSNLNTQK